VNAPWLDRELPDEIHEKLLTLISDVNEYRQRQRRCDQEKK
jgi:hypothetical protein